MKFHDQHENSAVNEFASKAVVASSNVDSGCEKKHVSLIQLLKYTWKDTELSLRNVSVWPVDDKNINITAAEQEESNECTPHDRSENEIPYKPGTHKASFNINNDVELLLQVDEESFSTDSTLHSNHSKPYLGRASGANELARRDIGEYTAEIFRRHHRCHLFSIATVQSTARFLRWDRSGVIASTPVSFNEETGLKIFLTFLYRFARMSRSERGHDTSMLEPSIMDLQLLTAFRTTKLPTLVCNHQEFFSEAFDVKTVTGEEEWPIRKVVLKPLDDRNTDSTSASLPNNEGLKDSWRYDDKAYHPELEVYKKLQASGVKYIAKAEGGGYVHDPDSNDPQVTVAHSYLSKLDKFAHLKQSHYRLLSRQLGTPLEQYSSSMNICLYIYLALLGHRGAFRAGVLHGDLSPNNILIDEAPEENGWLAFLHDWDLCKYKEELNNGTTHKSRSGTWAFMSGMSELCKEHYSTLDFSALQQARRLLFSRTKGSHTATKKLFPEGLRASIIAILADVDVDEVDNLSPSPSENALIKSPEIMTSTRKNPFNPPSSTQPLSSDVETSGTTHSISPSPFSSHAKMVDVFKKILKDDTMWPQTCDKDDDNFVPAISATFEALGEGIGVRCAVVVGGGEDRVTQAITLAKRPHIIIATPGRLLDHLQSTKGFNLRNLKYLVLDEADRLLDMGFGPSIDQILKFIPKDRSTYLFSATMTTQVSKLQRASLSNPVKVEVSSKYQTVPTLLQYFALCPLDKKEALFVHLINSLTANTIITFTRTVQDTERLGIMLRHLGFSAVLLHGQLSQSHRLGALNQFKSGNRRILVATDVASRGLDIPCVDIVINYDVPLNSKDYIHRVGRTARAGRSGKSISIVTQYDVEFIQRIEKLLDRKLEMWPVVMEEILLLKERVDDAGRIAAQELKEQNASVNRKRKVPRVSMDDEEDSSRATRNRKRTRR
ncbi:hypothetical protein ABKN59_005659 [Abortiporus biennis]